MRQIQSKVRWLAGLIYLVVTLLPESVLAADGKLLTIKVHGASLEGNLLGESPDRDVSVYLPPSYDSEPGQRYPTLYLLHGIGDTDKTWTQGGENWGAIQHSMDRLIGKGLIGEMIVVMPNEMTQYAGSFYTNSSVTGRWEDFTVRELVAYIDSNYRTLARVASRGVAGHSMGGYGAIKLGMKHPEVYSVVYGLNPAVLGWANELSQESPAFAVVANDFGSLEELIQAGGVVAAGLVCVGQAFSPNPDSPPFYADMPFAPVGRPGNLGRVEPAFGRWEANMPTLMVDNYVENLKILRGIKFDSGYEDEFTHIPATCRQLSQKLTEHEIDHIFEEYNGDHRNRLWGPLGRIETELLPFFSELLEFAP